MSRALSTVDLFHRGHSQVWRGPSEHVCNGVLAKNSLAGSAALAWGVWPCETMCLYLQKQINR